MDVVPASRRHSRSPSPEFGPSRSLEPADERPGIEEDPMSALCEPDGNFP